MQRAHEWLDAALALEPRGTPFADRSLAEAYFGFKRAARAAFRERPELAPPGTHATASGRRRRRATDRAKPKPPAFRVVACQHSVGLQYFARVVDLETGDQVAACGHRHRTTKAARACGVRMAKAARKGQTRIV